jgi:zinc/manganese transport system substrate-binding protein
MRNFILFGAILLATAIATPAAAALKVFACEPDWAALAKELGADDVDIYTATSARQDVHKIQARPSLIARYRQADLVVCTGSELEIGWLPALADKANNPAVLPGTPGYFEASAHVKMLEIPARFDRSQGDIHPNGNPHVQTDPRNIAPIAQALAERLAELDHAHAAAYRERLGKFSARWTAALEKWEQRAKPLKGVSLVSHHKTWVYLYAWLGIREIATLEPKPAIPPSAAHLEDVLASVKRNPIRLVVYSAYEDPHAAEWLAQRVNVPAVQLPLSVGGAPGADDLFGLYDVTLERLLGALGAGKKS